MSLGDISAFGRWVEIANPTLPVWRHARWWVADLAVKPWQAPSRPVPEQSDQPIYEVRTAEIPRTGGIEIVYRYWYDTEVVDLIWIG